jgi:hypothetical protein
MAATPQCLFMVIEALINGQVLTREEVSDEYLGDVEGANPQQNFEYRETLIRMYVAQLRQKMEKFFNPDFQVEYRLVFQSTMKENETDQRTNKWFDASHASCHRDDP